MIRAVVIDDSAYNRVTLSRMLQSSPDVKVVATATDGEDGIKQVLRSKPDVITLDLEMPVMDGFAFLRWLMVNHPTPVIAVSSRSSDRSVFKALELGAVDFIAKPGGRVSPRLEEIQAQLLYKVHQIANVRIENIRSRLEEEEEVKPFAPALLERPRQADLIVIGASTGGPPAIQTLLQNLPLMPIPLVIAQHMPATFTRLFAERVNRLTPYNVRELQNGEDLVPGAAYIAPGGYQTDVRRHEGGLIGRVTEKSHNELYAPSVNRLFETAADACGGRLVAALLTGMGDDGAEGMKKIRSRGGRTIAESSETAIVFGMPAEAIKAGAVEEVHPLPGIAAAIARMAVGSDSNR
jgi:Chemotaxis response regulator containing a CheY-like receiver domain and a methylesterase domain